MPIRRQVVVVDVGDDRQHRLQHKKRGVGLVGLRDQELPCAKPRVRIRGHELAADDESRIEAAFSQHAGDEAGGGGLAVRTGHGDALLEPHQFGEHQCARHHRDSLFARCDDFDVVARDSGRNDHHIGAGDVPGYVSG